MVTGDKPEEQVDWSEVVSREARRKVLFNRIVLVWHESSSWFVIGYRTLKLTSYFIILRFGRIEVGVRRG